ncbi:hypothetical protein EX30DRAFT_341129 [Ascodesmis nigricans]|uniref:Transmembrane protein n=1 Tax=Ascodesmis nigricans TaxID=341454 RepID=A0A4S2MW29_9PEZI|nr:hypothetical protein EX30DRAFT_341129 [Ascodesmis nigricans]
MTDITTLNSILPGRPDAGFEAPASLADTLTPITPKSILDFLFPSRPRHHLKGIDWFAFGLAVGAVVLTLLFVACGIVAATPVLQIRLCKWLARNWVLKHVWKGRRERMLREAENTVRKRKEQLEVRLRQEAQAGGEFW